MTKNIDDIIRQVIEDQRLANYQPEFETLAEELRRRDEQLRQLSDPYNMQDKLQSYYLPDLSLTIAQEMATARDKLLNVIQTPYTIEERLHIPTAHQSWLNELEKGHQQFADIAKSILTESELIIKGTQQSFSAIDFTGLSTIANIPESFVYSFHTRCYDLARDFEGLTYSLVDLHSAANYPLSAIPYAGRELYFTGRVVHSVIDDEHEDKDSEQHIAVPHHAISALPTLLTEVDPSLIALYEGAKSAIDGKNPDRQRHILVSLRELCMHLIHKLAPDQEVLHWVPKNDPKFLNDNRPTRRARIEYILRDINHGELVTFVSTDVKTILHLFELLNKVHKINPSYSKRQLEAILLRTESFLTFILSLHK